MRAQVAIEAIVYILALASFLMLFYFISGSIVNSLDTPEKELRKTLQAGESILLVPTDHSTPGCARRIDGHVQDHLLESSCVSGRGINNTQLGGKLDCIGIKRIAVVGNELKVLCTQSA